MVAKTSPRGITMRRSRSPRPPDRIERSPEHLVTEFEHRAETERYFPGCSASSASQMPFNSGSSGSSESIRSITSRPRSTMVRSPR